MDLKLSWDLFIVVFFVIIVAYSLIIGRDNTIKVILGTYVALVCADAIGGLIGQYFGGTVILAQMAHEARFTGVDEAIVFTKVLIFILMVILFAVKGAFDVGTARNSSVVGLVLHLFYSICSAGLILSSVLVLVSGVSILSGGGAVNEALSQISNNSILVSAILHYHNLLFAIPSVAFLVHSLKGGEE